MLAYTYKIYYVNNPEIFYIGSTKQSLSRRLAGHRTSYKLWLKRNKGKCMIYPYFQEYGIENFKIVELTRFEYIDTQHQFKMEQEQLELYPNCVNKCFAFGYDIQKIKDRYEESKKDGRRAITLSKYCKTEKYKATRQRYLETEKGQIQKQKRLEYAKREDVNERRNIKRRELAEKSLESKRFCCEDCDYLTKTNYQLKQHFKSWRHIKLQLPFTE